MTPGVIAKRGANLGEAAIITAMLSSAESIAKDVAHGQSIDWGEAALQAPLGLAGSLFGDLLDGLVASMRGEPNEFMDWFNAYRKSFSDWDEE